MLREGLCLDQSGRAAERLTKLFELRNTGLISEQEYQAKRLEILNSM